MRGKVCFNCSLISSTGITPAYAGKSLTIPKLTTRSWDHPRVCGEKRVICICVVLPQGSPPRMRGKADKEVSP